MPQVSVLYLKCLNMVSDKLRYHNCMRITQGDNFILTLRGLSLQISMGVTEGEGAWAPTGRWPVQEPRFKGAYPLLFFFYFKQGAWLCMGTQVPYPVFLLKKRLCLLLKILGLPLSLSPPPPKMTKSGYAPEFHDHLSCLISSTGAENR